MIENIVKKDVSSATLDDLDEEFYGDESFNEDEFDLDGFDDFKE